MADTPAASGEVPVRDAVPDDIPAIAAIYGHHVLTGLASFEEEPPDTDEMRRRYDALRDNGFPYVVAVPDGVVAGYGYAGPYRTRPAYRHSVECSVYLDDRVRGRGIGTLLLRAVIDRAKAAGFRQMVAIIGDSENKASIGLHTGLGFEMTGVLRSVGFKHGRWVDTVIMQRKLGHGDHTPPTRNPVDASGGMTP